MRIIAAFAVLAVLPPSVRADDNWNPFRYTDRPPRVERRQRPELSREEREAAAEAARELARERVEEARQRAREAADLARQRERVREEQRRAAAGLRFLRAAVSAEQRALIKSACAAPRYYEDYYDIDVRVNAGGLTLSCRGEGDARWTLELRADAFTPGYAYLHEGTEGQALVIETALVPSDFARRALDQKVAALDHAGIRMNTLVDQARVLGRELNREKRDEDAAAERARRRALQEERVNRFKQPQY